MERRMQIIRRMGIIIPRQDNANTVGCQTFSRRDEVKKLNPATPSRTTQATKSEDDTPIKFHIQKMWESLYALGVQPKDARQMTHEEASLFLINRSDYLLQQTKMQAAIGYNSGKVAAHALAPKDIPSFDTLYPKLKEATTKQQPVSAEKVMVKESILSWATYMNKKADTEHKNA